MNNEQQEMQIIPTDGIIATSPTVIPMDDIEDAVVLDDIDPDNHPNFIESNTSAVTFEELTEKCIVPTLPHGFHQERYRGRQDHLRRTYSCRDQGIAPD